MIYKPHNIIFAAPRKTRHQNGYYQVPVIVFFWAENCTFQID